MSRYRNFGILITVLTIEIVVLAYQVHKNRDVPLLRQIAILVVTPIDKGIRVVSGGTWSVWRNYMDLRGARRENRELVGQLNEIKLENQRLQEEAAQGRRLQALLQFKEEVPSETVAAQVISSGASETSRVLIIDKGQDAGLRPDMAVIVPDGIVGKVLRVFPYAAQVLLITDPNSGVACLLERSRVHGVLRGQNKSQASLGYVVNDDKVQIGERVFTSGEDRIYPKGLPVGVVVEAHPGASFQEISVQPFAKLDRLEEVLIVTKKVDVELPPAPAEALAEPLAATVPAKPAPPPSTAPPTTDHAATAPPATPFAPAPKPAPSPSSMPKPQGQSGPTPAKPQIAKPPANPAAGTPSSGDAARPENPPEGAASPQ